RLEELNKARNNDLITEEEHELMRTCLFDSFAPQTVAPRRKRSAEDEVSKSSIAKQRKFAVNGTIKPNERMNYYFIDPGDYNIPLIQKVMRGEYILMHGPRASGKSTRTWRAMEQLHKYGYVCVYITLHDLTLRDEETFWRSFGQAFTRSLNGYFGRNGTMFQSKIPIPDITSVEILQNVIAKSNDLWSEVRNFRAERTQQVPENPLIIFVDEFDSVSISNTICMSFLNKVRGIKTNDIYAFTKKDVKCLFQQFHEDHSDIGYHVADRAIEIIYRNSNGHSGLVNLCGRAIENWLRKWYRNCGKTNMTFAEWLFYSAINLQNEIPTYTTFDEMLKNLHKKEGAMNLLRTYFLGSLDSVVITNDHE
ncbi:6358_t:CDS:2, partial [Paraglomus brasilianum]